MLLDVNIYYSFYLKAFPKFSAIKNVCFMHAKFIAQCILSNDEHI